jgi:hypothetical protein
MNNEIIFKQISFFFLSDQGFSFDVITFVDRKKKKKRDVDRYISNDLSCRLSHRYAII